MKKEAITKALLNTHGYILDDGLVESLEAIVEAATTEAINWMHADDCVDALAGQNIQMKAMGNAIMRFKRDTEGS
jgi:hypothetical protein